MNKIVFSLNFDYNLLIEFTEKGITRSEWVKKKATPFPKKAPLWLKSLKQELKNWDQGKKANFEVAPLDDETLTSFRKKVYQRLKKVPAGTTITYQELAHKIGSTKGARAVGTAMRTNKAPLIIPCHRVVRSDGSLGNYTAPGGAMTKKALLLKESSCL